MKRIKDNIMFLPDEEFDRVSKKTGELRQSRRVVRVKSMDDFFIIYIAAWDDFNKMEGMQSKIFRQCMKVSRITNAENGDGNTFIAAHAIKEIRRMFPEMSENAARQHLYRLCKLGFIKQTDTRGVYSLNPKYGIKGVINEDTYGELVIKACSRKEAELLKKLGDDDVVTIKHNAEEK